MDLFGRRTWVRFVALARPLFLSKLRWKALGLLSLLVLVLLSLSSLNVVNSYVGRDFMTAVAERQPGVFYRLALLYAGVFLILTTFAGFKQFTEERLSLLWRRGLTEHLTDTYLAARAYYWVGTRGDIDNPDQRIAEDVKTFTSTSLSLLLILVNSTITLCAFSGILWSITPRLFGAAALYAVFGSILAVLVGRRLVGLDIVQLKREANLRYELIRVREHAEAVALLRGEDRERGRILGRLDELVATCKTLIGLNRNLVFFTEGYNYMVQIIPILIAAPLYMAGEIEFGMVTQGAAAFGHVLGAFSVIIKEFQRISTFAAVITRLGSVWEAIVEPPTKSALETVEDAQRVAYDHLTLTTSRGSRQLLHDLTAEVPVGKHLLIRGTAAARSALVRASAGLWLAGQGGILRPPLGDIAFLPQQPYLVPSTLRGCFPRASATGLPQSDRRTLTLLDRVGLGSLPERVGGLDVERDWAKVLSLAEQQMLAFAVLLAVRPAFAFLDEATSALDARHTRRLYRLLARTRTTYISAGNNPVLLRHHAQALALSDDGAWQLTPTAPSEAALSPRLGTEPAPWN